MNNNNSSLSSGSSFLENNKIVFLLSLFIALVCWGIVSMNNTKEVERTITGVKVQITDTEELLENFGLSIFDKTDYFLDVTLKGYSYLLRDLTADNIDLSASCLTVAAAGTYDLNINASLSGNTNKNIKISKISSSSIKVYFDTEISKTFSLTEDIVELPGYSIAEGCSRENPILSVDSLTVSGPARDINRIVAVKAHVKLNKTLSATERFSADIVLESENGIFDNSLFSFEPDGPVYVTIPINHTGTYTAIVEFVNMPQAYKNGGIEYSVSPSTVDITSMTSVDTTLNQSYQISVGTIDFNDIRPGAINSIELTFDSGKGATTYVVSIDMTDADQCNMYASVDISNISLPDGVTVKTKNVGPIVVAGPEDSVLKMDDSAIYAVPVIDDPSSLTPGEHYVPAKIVFRTNTDCWVYGKYDMLIVAE